jgi:hypothetical protein
MDLHRITFDKFPSPELRRDLDSYFQDSALSFMLADVLKVVTIEGPVHRDIVIERLRLPFGAEKTRSRFRTAVEDVISQLVRGGQILDSKEGFLATPANVPGDSVQVRVPTADYPQTYRTVEQVPPSEIRQAMINLVHDARVIDESEFFVRVARIFGWARNGAVITRNLSAQLELLIRRQVLEKQDGRISSVTSTAD